ncbi:MAG: SMI1/KNR4 family protein [Thermoanaerobaculia bacterium]
MKLTDIQVTEKPLVLATEAEVDAVERELGTRMPQGYREYITRFGEGVLGGCYIRVYPPWRIIGPVDHFSDWRDRVKQYWFWDQSRDILSKEEAAACYVVGDTLDGDELVVHPSHPDRIYILPRHFETIYIAAEGLLETCDWLCSAGVLTEAFEEREFDSHDTRNA